MELRLIVNDINLKHKANYFLFIQYEELKFPSKETIIIKNRTEIKPETSSPKFYKNLFLFKNVNLGSRISIKFAIYHVKTIRENISEKILSELSQLYCYNQYTFTQNFLNNLRLKKHIHHNLKLYNKEERGIINFEIKLDLASLKEIIKEDIYLLQELYYDCNEEIKDKIIKSINNIITTLNIKQYEYTKLKEKYEILSRASELAEDKKFRLKNKIVDLRNETKTIKEKIDNKNNIDELGIQIDLLITTPNGRDILRQKYGCVY